MLIFVVGAVPAVVHYIFFDFLNTREVDSILLPQSWVSPISTALGRVFSLSLGISLGTAYVQLWHRLRRSPTKIGIIDKLFSMQSNPSKLFSLSVIRTSPLLWRFAVFLPLIPIATIFPPGAITVVSVAKVDRFSSTVPTYDFYYRGNNDSYQNFANNALFLMGSDGEFRLACMIQTTSRTYRLINLRFPKSYLSRVAKATAMSGSYLTTTSPCGNNCTYHISVPGPELDCVNGIGSETSLQHRHHALREHDFQRPH